VTVYAVRVAGHLDERWASWFEDASISPEADGTTTLRLTVVDQAQLHGLLGRVRDLGITLVSVAVVPR
jgi:hypothetical protein